MIDERLKQRFPYLARQERRLLDAKSDATQLSTLGARAWLASVFSEMLNESLEEASEMALFEAFSKVLAAKPQPASLAEIGFADDVERALRSPGEAARPGTNLIMGQALLDALVSRSCQPRDFSVMAGVVSEDELRLEGLVEGLELLSTDLLQLFKVAFGSFAENLGRDPHRHVFRGRSEGLAETIERWATQTDIRSVWESRDWVGFDMHPDNLGIVSALVCSKPQDFLSLAERMKLLPLVQAALMWQTLRLDLDRLLGHLLLAPSTMDPATGLWNRKLTAPLLLDSAFYNVLDLASQRDAQGQHSLQEGEVSALAQKIIEHALRRDDAVLLVGEWMLHMVGRASTRTEDSLYWAALEGALSAFAHGGAFLPGAVSYPDSSASIPGSLPTQLSDHEGERALERLMLSTLASRVRREEGAEVRDPPQLAEVMSLMRHARRVLGPTLGEHMPSWRHHALADLYSRDAAPAQAWRRDFNALSVERRAGLHSLYSDDDTLMSSSIFHAGIGLALIDQTLGQRDGTTSSPQALVIWDEVFEATRVMSTHWSLSDDKWRQVASGLFARYPACARAAGVTSQASSLGWLRWLGGDEALLATAVANLVHNGMEFEQILSVDIGGPAIEDRLIQAISWDQASGQRTLAPGVSSYLQRELPRRVRQGT